jgi:hypothetical protein
MQSYKLYQSLKKNRVYVVEPANIESVSKWIVRPLSMLLTCADDGLEQVVVNFVM